jgi:2,3-bisphosphoglycerate-dependent phosphoglycerate mutase
LSGTTVLYVTRHGQTDANLETRVQGQGDTPLNAHGLAQAEALADYFSQRPSLPVDRIVSSDLPRARQTADILARRLKVPATFHPELRARRMGDFEGRTHAELEALDPEAFRRLKHDPAFVPPGGGESVNDLRARAIPFVQRLGADNPGRHIVLVSHHKVCQLVVQMAWGEPVEGGRVTRIPNARPAVVLMEGGRCRLMDMEAIKEGSHGR